MKPLTTMLLGLSLAISTASLPAFAKEKTKTKIKADGDDYKEQTTTKDKGEKETTRMNVQSKVKKSIETFVLIYLMSPTHVNIHESIQNVFVRVNGTINGEVLEACMYDI